MITIAGDIHLKTSTFCVLDEQGQRLARQKVLNDPDIIKSFIAGFPGKKQLSVEATYNWQVFYELLKNDVDEFHLLHPKKLQAIIQSQAKSDNADADMLAELTWRGRLPEAYTSCAETRQFRHLLRARVKVAQQIASVKNQVHALLNANIFYGQRPKNFKDLFCKRGLTYLQTVSLPNKDRFLVDQLLAEIQQLEKTKAQIQEYIEQAEFHTADIDLLSTVPGLKKSKLLKYIVASEIDQLSRFRNARALVAYAGLIPKEHSSGEKIRKGKLRTDSNTFLRWALIEASLGAILGDKKLKAYYQEVKSRNNSSAARVACARKLLTVVYHVLKERRPYYTVDQQPATHCIPSIAVP